MTPNTGSDDNTNEGYCSAVTTFRKSFPPAAFVIAWFGWIFAGMECAAGGLYFLPVPFLGYTRFDIAVLFILVELGALRYLYRQSSSRRGCLLLFATIFVGLMLASIGLKLFPFYHWKQIDESVYVQPYPDIREVRRFGLTQDPPFYLQKIEESWGFDKPYPDITELRVSPGVLSHIQAKLVEQLVLDNKERWTKESYTYSLGHFIFGSRKTTAKQMKREGSPYTFRHGFRLTPYRDLCRESDFVLHCKTGDEFSLLSDATGDLLYDIFSSALNVTPDKIVIGNGGNQSISGDVGHPAVLIFYPHLFWQFILNAHQDTYIMMSHTDFLLKMGKDSLGMDGCIPGSSVSIIIPISAEGAGLYFWTKDGKQHHLMYEVGSVYTFPVTMIHAAAHASYFEYWRNKRIRMTIQAFAIQCGDKWHVMH